MDESYSEYRYRRDPEIGPCDVDESAFFYYFFTNLKILHPKKISPPSGAIFCPEIQVYVGIVAIFLLFSAPQAKNLHFFRSTIQFPFYFPSYF